MNISETDQSKKEAKANFCASCGEVWNAQWKFCKDCGAAASISRKESSQFHNRNSRIKSTKSIRPKLIDKWFLKIDSKESAKKAVTQAYVVAYIIAGITMIFAFISLVTGQPVGGIDGSAMLDALLFALVGIGIQFYSRTAAVAGLGLFILEKIYMIYQNQMNITSFLITIVLCVGLINGIRGTWAYHRFRNLNNAVKN